MAVETKVFSYQAAMAQIHAIERRAKNLRPAYREFKRHLQLHNAAQFATEGIQSGRKFAPLSPPYAAWKFAHFGPRPILTATGKMRFSFTIGLDSRIGRRRARFGSGDSKAIYHQRGTRHMPARPPLVVTERLQNELGRVVADYVAHGRFSV